MCSRYVRVWQKGHSSYVNLAAALSQGFVLAQTRIACIPDVSRTCSGSVLHMFHTCVIITLELHIVSIFLKHFFMTSSLSREEAYGLFFIYLAVAEVLKYRR